MWKSTVMNIFFISFPTAWRSEVIARGTQISRLGTTSPISTKFAGPRHQAGNRGGGLICRSCWTGNSLCKLHKFLQLRPAIGLQDLKFYYLCGSLGLYGLQSFRGHWLLTISCSTLEKILPMRRKNATWQRRYCHAVVSRWAIEHFDFQKLAGLWLARMINNHVRIYGSNVDESFFGVPTSVLFTF